MVNYYQVVCRAAGGFFYVVGVWERPQRQNDATMTERRTDLRNIAIIAHVDHGKTTLVDAILRQTRVHRNITSMGERIMDSMDQERERGITIKAKNASVSYNGVKINIVDTPGHADFGGEVERTLRMVDGVLLVVDAKEGPMPQTTFVLRKALALGHKAIVVINKVDRQDAQIEEVVNRTFDLFSHLGANDEQLDFPLVYTSAINGTASLDNEKPGINIFPLLDTILTHIPAPPIFLDRPLQMLVLALAYDPYKGKMAIGKLLSGKLTKRQMLTVISPDGTQVSGRTADFLVFEGLERKEVESVDAGEIVAVAGFPEVSIGATLSDAEHPVALPPVAIEQPTVHVTFAVNNSPFAGREGKYVTSRHLRDRLYRELETNVSLRVEETDSADAFLVAGRGELHLAVLIEAMRREGYELQVSQPKVIVSEQNGEILEPYEELAVEVPVEFQGAVIEEVGPRRGELRHMKVTAHGNLQLEYYIPTRGVIGLKSALLTKTKGTVILHHTFHAYAKLEVRDLEVNTHGSLVAHETGISSAYGLAIAQERGELFIGPQVEVYQGMVVGHNARDEDLDVNVCKAKHLTNMRASGSDEAIVLTTPREMTLELALEYIGPDELIEVTPASLRLRKRLLDQEERRKARKSRGA
jgi:GTP-binding protein